MLGSSRFVIGIHVLAILARAQGKGPVCSGFIAQSVNTNPVVIRRLMANMEQAALVKSIAGRKGMAVAEMERWLAPVLGYDPA